MEWFDQISHKLNHITSKDSIPDDFLIESSESIKVIRDSDK